MHLLTQYICNMYMCEFSSDKTLRLALANRFIRLKVCVDERRSSSASNVQWNSIAAKFISSSFYGIGVLLNFVMIYCERSVGKIVGKTEKWKEKENRAQAKQQRWETAQEEQRWRSRASAHEKHRTINGAVFVAIQFFPVCCFLWFCRRIIEIYDTHVDVILD